MLKVSLLMSSSSQQQLSNSNSNSEDEEEEEVQIPVQEGIESNKMAGQRFKYCGSNGRSIICDPATALDSPDIDLSLIKGLENFDDTTRRLIVFKAYDVFHNTKLLEDAIKKAIEAIVITEEDESGILKEVKLSEEDKEELFKQQKREIDII